MNYTSQEEHDHFEGAAEQSVPQKPMTYTEKILEEEFDKKFPSHGYNDNAENEFHSQNIKRFLIESITQALAEERKRVGGEIEGMKGLVANPDYFIRVQRELRGNQATEGLDDMVITQIVWVAKDRVLDDLLSSLDRPIP